MKITFQLIALIACYMHNQNLAVAKGGATCNPSGLFMTPIRQITLFLHCKIIQLKYKILGRDGKLIKNL